MTQDIYCYLDESGIHDGAEVCVIAGYFGRLQPWKRFEELWKNVLETFRVPLEDFHAVEVMNRGSEVFRRMNRVTHRLFIEELCRVATACKIHPVSFGVLVPDFFSFSLNQRRFFTGAWLEHGRLVGTGSPNKPYYAPFQRLLSRIADYTPAGARAHFYLGLDRKPFSGYAKALYSEIKQATGNNRERLGDISFPMAKETPQLQVSDLLVYLTYRHMVERIKTRDWLSDPSETLQSLHRGMLSPDDAVFVDQMCLRGHLDLIPAEQRGQLEVSSFGASA